MNTNMKWVCLIVFLCGLNIAKGLKCYSCSVTEFDVDQRCVTNPEAVEIGSPIINCDKKYCTSTRQEYIDPKGKVVSMSRQCLDKPTFLNEVIEDATYIYYFRACQEDLCNGGTGHDTSGGNAIIDQDTKGVIYTEGIGPGAGAANIQMNIFVSMTITLIVLLYWKTVSF